MPATLAGSAWRRRLPGDGGAEGAGPGRLRPVVGSHVAGSRLASFGPVDFGQAPAEVRNRNQVWNSSPRGLRGAAKGCACGGVSPACDGDAPPSGGRPTANPRPSAPQGKFRPRRPSAEVRTLAGQCRRVLGAGTGGPRLLPLPSRTSLTVSPPRRWRGAGARAGHPLPSLAVQAELPLRHRPGPGAGLTCQPAPRLAAPNAGRGRMTDGPAAQPERGCWAAGQ